SWRKAILTAQTRENSAYKLAFLFHNSDKTSWDGTTPSCLFLYSQADWVPSSKSQKFSATLTVSMSIDMTFSDLIVFNTFMVFLFKVVISKSNLVCQVIPPRFLFKIHPLPKSHGFSNSFAPLRSYHLN